MALPSLREIKAGQAKLSSTHLQGSYENNAAAVAAKFFPEQQPLRHIGARSEHRLPEVGPGQALGLVNTEVTRITPGTVSLSRAASRIDDPSAVVEGPVILSKGQMTPRAETMLLPPLAELSHADYLQRAGGSEDRLSEKHWDRAVEQLQNGFGVPDIAQELNVDAGQVTTVRNQLIETHPESIAAAPSARSASPSVSEQAAQPTQAILLSRRGSLETLVTETVNWAQRQHIGKTSAKAIDGFNQGLAALNAKPGKELIEASSAQAHYRKVAGEKRPAPEAVRHQKAKRAKTLGVGETPADYDRHIKAELAKTLGLGERGADYDRHQKAERAKTLGLGETAADYERHINAKLAKTLGVGETAADYDRHKKAERAMTLGVGETAADYTRHQKAERAKTLGLGETAADDERHRKQERAAVAEQARAGDRSRSRSR